LEIRYRLRKGSQITGYMRRMKGSKTFFFSKDQFWWNGSEIDHDQIDEAIGIRDINNRPIYELDIVNYKLGDGGDRQGAVIWSKQQNVFMLKDLEDRDLYVPFRVEDLDLFEPQDLRFHAFLFNHPELMRELGVRDE